MPRLDHRVTVEQQPYHAQMLLAVTVQMLNQLRTQLGLPEITAQQTRQLLRDYLRDHPARPQGAHNGPP